MKPETDAVIAAVASKTTFAGAATSVIAWMKTSEFGVVAGVLIGLMGLMVNWYFRRREDRRAQAAEKRELLEHEARMRKLARDSKRGDL
jgi:hypothetical protein